MLEYSAIARESDAASAGRTAMLSNRLPGHAEINALSRAVEAVKAAGTPLVDLTESNPTNVGLPYPADLLTAAASERALRYDPQPFGLRSAREAVAADYARRQVAIDPSHIVLSASTSEAYSWLFKLLCNPGDGVLIPQPSYPLFEHLTRLDAVRAIPYRLEYHGRWEIDLDSVAAAPPDVARDPARVTEQPDRVVRVRTGSGGTRGDRSRSVAGRSSPTKCSPSTRSRRSRRRRRSLATRAYSRSRSAVRRSRWVCRRSSWPG